MKKFWELLKNEYKRFFSDQGAFLIMIIGVLVYPIIYAIPYSPELVNNMPVGVIDYDNTKMSRQFIRMVDENENTDVIKNFSDPNEAQEDFYKDKIKGYFIVPYNFERDILRGEKTNISLYCDSAYLIVYKQITSSVQGSAKILSSGIELNKIMKEGKSRNEGMKILQPYELVSIPLYNSQGGYASYIYPVVLLLIIQQTFLVGVALVGATQREKKEKFVNPHLTILSKTICYSSTYFVYSFVYFIILPWILKYSVYYNFTMFLVIIPFLFAVCLLGQTLTYLFKEREYSIITLAVLGLPFLILPGFIWPKEAMPFWLNIISKLVPSTSAVDGMIRLNQMNASFSQIYLDIIILIGLCVLYYIGAYFALKTINQNNSLKAQ